MIGQGADVTACECRVGGRGWISSLDVQYTAFYIIERDFFVGFRLRIRVTIWRCALSINLEQDLHSNNRHIPLQLGGWHSEP